MCEHGNVSNVCMAWTASVCKQIKKPLVPVMNTYDLDKAPPNCQRLIVCPLRFYVVAEHIPGKHLIVADTLSRSPLTEVGDRGTDFEVQVHVESVVAKATVSSQKLCANLCSPQQDVELQKIIGFIRNGWPPKTSLFPSLHGYYSLLLTKTLHEGHQGQTRCRTRARMSRARRTGGDVVICDSHKRQVVMSSRCATIM